MIVTVLLMVKLYKLYRLFGGELESGVMARHKVATYYC